MSNNTTHKCVRKLVEAIIGEGSEVYTTDAGNGSGGPGKLYPDDLRALLDSGDIDDYKLVKTAWDGRAAAEIISHVLDAHAHPDDGTAWLLAERVTVSGQNPYRDYLLLWEF